MKKSQNKILHITIPSKSIAERAYDLWSELLLEKETSDILKEIKAEQDRGGNQEIEGFFSKYDKKYLGMIEKYSAHKKHRHIFFNVLPKLARVAAIIIAIAAVGGSISLAASPYLRIQVVRLLTIMTPQYTEVRLVEDPSASFDIPFDWEGTHYFFYLPDDLEVVSLLNSGDFHMVTYRGIIDKDMIIVFHQSGSSGVSLIDTEGAQIRTVEIRGQAATLVTKGESTTIYWAEGVNVFFINGKNVDEDTMIRIAQSVYPIK